MNRDRYAALMHPGPLAELARPPDWHRDAACAGHPVEWFFPGRGEPVDQARALCNGCLVRAECRDYALTDPDAFAHGVWGATSARERRTLRRGAT